MKVNKVVKVGGAYAKKEAYEYEGKHYEADIQNGDTVTILDGGTEVTGQFGEQTVFTIKTRNGDKNYPINQGSINILIDAFGDDTLAWVGKEVKVLTKKGIFAGKKGIASYLVTDAYELDDFGELVKKGETSDVPFEG